jgi:ribosomal protein S27AE
LTKKKCPDCGKMKPLGAFYLYGGNVLDYHCKKCHDILFKGHKQISRDKVREVK